MKKTMSLLSLFAIVLVSFSCNKGKKENLSGNSNSSKNVKTTSTELSVGQMHNIILNQYILNYGLEEFPNMNYTSTSTMIARLSNIGVQKGFYGQITSQNMSTYVMNNLVSSHCFDQNQSLKSFNDCYIDFVNRISNQNIRSAIANIKYLSEHRDQNFIQSSRQMVQSLTNLTPDEIIMMDGYLSVLENSNELWQARGALPATNTAVIEAAADAIDAMGYAVGFANARIADGMSISESRIYGAAYAVALSSAFYKKVAK
jgi:hypothetical protein